MVERQRWMLRAAMGVAAMAWAVGLGIPVGPPVPAASAQATGDVTVRWVDFAFDPPEVTVPLGAKVTWVYEDGQCDLLSIPPLECPGHDSLAEVNGPDGQPLWKSPTIKGQGMTFTATMTQVGSIPYICTLHQSAPADMDAVVNVVAAAPAAATGGATATAPPAAGGAAGGRLPVTGATPMVAVAGAALLTAGLVGRRLRRPRDARQPS